MSYLVEFESAVALKSKDHHRPEERQHGSGDDLLMLDILDRLPTREKDLVDLLLASDTSSRQHILSALQYQMGNFGVNSLIETMLRVEDEALQQYRLCEEGALQVSKSPSLQVSKSPSLQVSKSPSLQVSKSPSLQVSKGTNVLMKSGALIGRGSLKKERALGMSSLARWTSRKIRNLKRKENKASRLMGDLLNLLQTA